MNGMFLNSRGLRDLAKHVRIADFIRDQSLDFVGISETGKQDFSSSLLNRISGGVDFTWISRPPHGRSGGLLLGVRKDTMDVLTSSDGDFHIKVNIRNKVDNFTWSLVTVYGAAQDEHKPAFLRARRRWRNTKTMKQETEGCRRRRSEGGKRRRNPPPEVSTPSGVFIVNIYSKLISISPL